MFQKNCLVSQDGVVERVKEEGVRERNKEIKYKKEAKNYRKAEHKTENSRMCIFPERDYSDIQLYSVTGQGNSGSNAYPRNSGRKANPSHVHTH